MSYVLTYYDKLRCCMGAVDVGYLKRFGELPTDTFEVLTKGGTPKEQAFATVHRNMNLVSKQLMEQAKELERRKQESLFAQCPFCQPPT